MPLKRTVKAALLFVGIFSLFAGPVFAETAARSPEKVTIQLKWKHQFQFAGYYAAKEKGFYSQEGLDVTLRERTMPENYVEEVIKGNAQYGTADAGLFLYRARGQPVVLLAQIFQHSPLVFISRQDSGIISPYEMIGKTVRFDPANGNFAPLTATLIETIGSLSQVKAIPQSYDLNSFINGDVDVISAYLTDMPYKLQKMGVGFNVINPVNYGVDFYGDNLFTTDREISEHPKRVEKMIRASLKGWEYALSHKSEIIGIIHEKYAPDIDIDKLENEAKMTESMIIPDRVKIGSVNPLRYERIANLYFKIGVTGKREIPPGFFYHRGPNLFTQDEQSWLSLHPVLRAGVIAQGLPVISLGEDGGYHGMLKDYSKRLETTLGVKFKFVQGTRQHLVDQLANHEIDLILNLNKEQISGSDPFLLTGSYINLGSGVFADQRVNYVGTMEALKNKKVAVLNGTNIKSRLEAEYPELILVSVNDPREALRDIKKGVVFAYFGNILTTNYLIKQMGYTDIHLVAEPDYSYSLAMAVPEDTPILQDILQKGLNRISPEVSYSIYNRWVPLVSKEGVNYKIIVLLVVSFAALVFVIFTWNRRLTRVVANRTASLRESAELFRSLFKDHSAVKLILDPITGRIVDANAAAASYYGWPTEQLKQMSLQDFSTLSTEEIQNQLGKTRKGEKQYLEYRNRLADGSIRDVAVFASAINYEGRDLRHSIIHDITEQKIAENEKRVLEEEINQSRRMEALGQLAGGIAHDFNNMLSVIMGYTALALEKVDGSVHDDLTQVLEASQRSAGIISQLLGFARKQAVEPEILDLNGSIEAMLRMLRETIGEDITLTWVPGEDLWPVKMDPSQLDQILINLCVNARDAIGGVGEIILSTKNVTLNESFCEVHEDSGPGQFDAVAFMDNGSGMDEKTLGRIFEPFFTTKKRGEGTGLGLSTVYGVVKQNGGFIEVQSTPGEGSTFTVYLPRHPDIEENNTEEDNLQFHSAFGETVLVVEDDEAILDLEKRFLSEMGFQVLAASTPADAISLAQCEDRDIKLLVTDVVMPEMNGRNLAERVQEIYHDIKVLFISGYPHNIVDKHGVLEKGFNFLKKPITRNAFVSKIKETLSN